MHISQYLATNRSSQIVICLQQIEELMFVKYKCKKKLFTSHHFYIRAMFTQKNHIFAIKNLVIHEKDLFSLLFYADCLCYLSTTI